MHQLTKDPDRLVALEVSDTESSPARAMTAGELGRYLDYCTELLSLTGKLAALFVQRFDDAVVLQAVNEIEDLTNGLSRKVWQKITSSERRMSTSKSGGLTRGAGTGLLSTIERRSRATEAGATPGGPATAQHASHTPRPAGRARM
jgi:hypothetical protein